MLHWSAWERGVKSLYYLRSKSVQRAAFAGAEDKAEAVIDPKPARPLLDAQDRLMTSAWPASKADARPRGKGPATAGPFFVLEPIAARRR